MVDNNSPVLTGFCPSWKAYLGAGEYVNGKLYRMGTSEGYIMPNQNYTSGIGKYNYFYSLKDHLGNVRMVISDDADASQVQTSDYTAFGVAISSDASKNKYLYNDKELQDGTNWLDYGARMYQPELGRWMKVDNKAELYFSNSPFVYACNTPIQAIDFDGDIVIFINGNHFGDGATGYENWRKGTGSYNWKGSNSYWNDGNKSFDDMVMKQLGDNKSIYRDGAIGGFFGFASDNPIGVNTVGGRIRDGYFQGEMDAKAIISNLARDKTTGEIIETIKIITHSMGRAYGKGYLEALKEYIKTLSTKLQSQIKITLVAAFDPFQASSLNADYSISTQQFSHIGRKGRKDSDGMGWLANEKQSGVDDYFENNNEAAHSIFTFFNNITNLSEGNYTWNGTNWVCTTSK